MRNFKIRKLSRDNFIEAYGITPRTKTIDSKNGSTKRHSMFQFANKTVDEMEGDEKRKIACDDCDIMSRNCYNLEPISNNNNNNNTKIPTYSVLLHNDEVDYKIQQDTHNGHVIQDDPAPLQTSKAEITMSSQKVSYKGPSNRRVRKFSLKKFPSTGDIHKSVTKRSKHSVSSNSSNSSESKGGNWLSSWSSQLSLNKSSSKSFSSTASSYLTPTKSSSSSSTRRAAVFQIPAASFTASAHKGYLDRRNKKKQWERFWCVLQDSCMYCYNSPQSEVTQDAVVLRGYDVIADINNINRTTFPIRLERSGSPTLVFRCDSHRNFTIWVDTLKKDLARVMTEMSDNEVLVNSVKTTARQYRRGVSTPNKLSPTEGNNKSIVTSDESDGKQSLEMQKENLLREVLSQQQEILRDHTQISPEFARSISTSFDGSSPRRRKSDVIGKYEREKDNYENKILKNLTLLNRRRNSLQIKVDQLTKQLTPRNGRLNIPNSMLLIEMEARLEQFETQLNDIDKNIDKEQGKRMDTAEKIKQKRDLELLILDQRESLEIVRRHHLHCMENGGYKAGTVLRTKSSPTFSGNFPCRNNDQLTSIDEVSTVVSDESSSSGSSSNDFYSMSKTVTPRRVPLGRALSSTPMNYRLSHSNTELHTVRMRSKKKIDLPRDFTERRHSSEYKLSSSPEHNDAVLLNHSYSNVTEALSDDFRSLSTSSFSDVEITSGSDMTSRRTSSCATTNSDEKMEVSADVMAEIEEFEVFSKMKLQKLGACY